MTRAQTVLAFDFGLKRIGIACGDTLTRSAAPRPAAAAVRGNPDWQAIAREVRALTPGFLVVGAPYNVDGSEGGLSAAARSEEHTSELQSQSNLVCRLLLEKKQHSYHMS